jgi:hypothetical protein
MMFLSWLKQVSYTYVYIYIYPIYIYVENNIFIPTDICIYIYNMSVASLKPYLSAAFFCASQALAIQYCSQNVCGKRHYNDRDGDADV